MKKTRLIEAGILSAMLASLLVIPPNSDDLAILLYVALFTFLCTRFIAECGWDTWYAGFQQQYGRKFGHLTDGRRIDGEACDDPKCWCKS